MMALPGAAVAFLAGVALTLLAVSFLVGPTKSHTETMQENILLAVVAKESLSEMDDGQVRTVLERVNEQMEEMFGADATVSVSSAVGSGDYDE